MFFIANLIVILYIRATPRSHITHHTSHCKSGKGLRAPDNYLLENEPINFRSSQNCDLVEHACITIMSPYSNVPVIMHTTSEYGKKEKEEVHLISRNHRYAI